MFDKLNSLFGSVFNIKGMPKASGLILDDPEALAALPRHELFAGGGAAVDWAKHCPVFRNQGVTNWCTAYAGTAITSMFTHAESGRSVVFSPMELFYRSGGVLIGNTLMNTAQCMRDSVVLEADLPTTVPPKWDLTTMAALAPKAKASAEALERGKAFRMKGFAIVEPDNDAIRAALGASPVYAAIPVGNGFWEQVAPNPTKVGAYHAVPIVAIDADGTKTIYDSLAPKGGFDGFHRLAPDYKVNYAFSFLDLPDDWQKIQERAVSNRCLDHYGKPRDAGAERFAANQMSYLIKKDYRHLAGVAGRYWLEIVNMRVYGGYSVTDVVNHLYSIYKGKGPIWDVNKTRKEQEKW